MKYLGAQFRNGQLVSITLENDKLVSREVDQTGIDHSRFDSGVDLGDISKLAGFSDPVLERQIDTLKTLVDACPKNLGDLSVSQSARLADQATILDAPYYRSLKKVQAIKISEIKPVEVDPSMLIIKFDDGVKYYQDIKMSVDWAIAKKAEVGGYLVIYEDGYISYSPPESFIKGNVEMSGIDQSHVFGVAPFSMLKHQLLNDSEYAWGWHCNLAMSALDASLGALTREQANAIAAAQMRHVFGIDTSSHPNYQK